MKLSNIISGLQRRARKVTNDRALFIVNKLVGTDILMALHMTYPDYFQKKEEIDMIDGTLEYALPDDFGNLRKITNEFGYELFRNGKFADNENENRVQVYGGKVYVDENRRYKKLFIEYNRKMPQFTKTDAIDLPDNMIEDLEIIWVTGLEYYYFSDNKKTQETQTSFTRYDDAKNNVFTFGLTSLV